MTSPTVKLLKSAERILGRRRKPHEAHRPDLRIEMALRELAAVEVTTLPEPIVAEIRAIRLDLGNAKSPGQTAVARMVPAIREDGLSDVRERLNRVVRDLSLSGDAEGN